MQEILRC